MLPVEVARQSATLLQESGAQVTYCEDKVGHRLGPSCYKRYEEFFS
jgi:predicted esterase